MKKLFTLFFLSHVAVSVFGQVPTISSFAPASGPIGTTVTVTGSNFNATPASNIVFFGATKATVVTASTTSLTVTVPVGANYQNISVTNLSNGLTAYSTHPFIVTFYCGGSFASKIDLTASTHTIVIAVGDLDGDGKSDIIVPDKFANAVSVFKNTSVSGNISFAAKVDFVAGSSPQTAAIGDLNGDGKSEIVTGNGGDNTVSILKNTSATGVLSFAVKVDIATGVNPHDIAIGDLDGDGKPDLAVVNKGANTVSVLRNTTASGIISFAAKVDFGTGTDPSSISIGDLDGDGMPDLALVNQGSNTASVLRNISTSGTVAFAAKADFIAGTKPYDIYVGDLDGDNKHDIIFTNHDNNTISALKNTSTSGTISFASKIDFPTGSNPKAIVINDIDGDGKPDVIVTAEWNGVVSVFRNTSTTGSISFAAKSDYTTGYTPNSVFAADLDGDGKSDLSVANGNGSDAVSVFRNMLGSLQPPSICMVTVDSISKNNVILWDKTSYANIDSFIVYRETGTNVYSRIGAVPYDSLSLFVDTVRTKYFPNTGDPNAGTYRYKLEMKDSCANKSALSPYHNTIFILNNSGAFSWTQHYTIENATNPVTSYILMRDDLSNGNWHAINSVSGTQQTVIDPNYLTYQSTGSWRVETQWNISCTPTTKNPQVFGFNSSRSNIYSLVNDVNEYYNNPAVSIYPNPTDGEFTVYGLGSGSKRLEIFDVFGKVVFQTTVNSKQEMLNPLLSNGIYFYKISDKDIIISTGKLIIK